MMSSYLLSLWLWAAAPAAGAPHDVIPLIHLGGTGAVTAPVAEAGARPSAKPDGRVWLKLEGLRLLRGGVYYQVYLDLPKGQKPDPQGPWFAGNLSLYGAEPGGSAELEHSFDVTELVRRHGRPKAVTFVRGGRPAPDEKAGDFITLRRVVLVE